MTTKTVNVNGKRRARHFSGPSVTLPRLSPGEGLRSVGEEILPLERAAVGLGVAAALCGLPAVSTGDTEASNHEAGGGPSGDDADAAPDSVDEHSPRLEDRARPHRPPVALRADLGDPLDDAVQPRGDRPTWPRDAALDRTELAEPRLDRARGGVLRVVAVELDVRGPSLAVILTVDLTLARLEGPAPRCDFL